MENKTLKINCPLCDKEEISFFSNKKGFNIYKCYNCKLLFIYPLPDSTHVYDKSYFSGAEKGFGYVDYDIDKEAMVPTFNKYFKLFGALGFKSGKLLDVGAATGFFANLAKNKGFEVTGVELSDFAAQKGRAKGLNIISGDIFSAKFSSEYFDIITLLDVIEHVPNPKTTLEEAKRILKPGGLLTINTPDAQSLWAKTLGPRWQLIMPPEHINYFSPQNMSDYLSQSGFKVILSTKIGKSFTIQYILKMLYKWTGTKIFLTNIFSKGFLSKIYVPINLRDNFFLIAQKNEK
jgi:2-polyprenyl-3-methyl-5-hydroxy-6-metoxy-1,4-benzoquinol methylase